VNTNEEQQELLEAIDAGNAGNLTIGKVLYNRINRGANKQALEAWLRNKGKKLPEASAQSKFVKAYETWVVNAGLDISGLYEDTSYTNDAGNPITMSLTGVSTYALYEARALVNRENPVSTLALVYNSTIDELKDMVRDAGGDGEPREELRSLPRIPKGTFDKYKQLEETGVFEELSRQEIIAFLFEFMWDLYELKPALITNAVRAYVGQEGDDNE
jgi:hypothetical protein